MSYLLDTYALIEWYDQGNSRYRPYFDPGVKRYLTKLTLLEFYHYVYHNKGKELAEKYYSHLKRHAEIVELTEDVLKKSAVFRSEMLKKGKRFSYADCVNYVSAKELRAKLLTGDREFEKMENVELVR
ncbi:MAG: PIN domain-containing protein [Candidatus Hadarchaeales archaeon]